MKSIQKPIVIVGAGFAGVTLALKLKNFNPSLPILIIDSKKNFIFKPLMYEILSKEINMWESIIKFLTQKNKYEKIIIKLHPRTEYRVRLFFKKFLENKNIIIIQQGLIESVFNFCKNCDLISPPSTTCFTAARLYNKKVYLLSSDFISEKVSIFYKNIDLGNFFPDRNSFIDFSYLE